MKSSIEFNIQDNPNKLTKEKPVFEPKYQMTNAYDKVVKEFVGSNKQIQNGSSIGHIKNQLSENNTFNRKDFSTLNNKEKKILDYNPNLSQEAIKKRVEQINESKQKELDDKSKEYQIKVGSNSRETYFNNLNSNIFNSKEREKVNKNFKPQTKETKTKEEVKGQEELSKENTIKAKPQSDLQGWTNTADWRNANTNNHFNLKEE